MKICLISDYLPEYHDVWGGGEKAAISIARLLASKKEHEVIVVTKKTKKIVKEPFKHYSLSTTEDCLGSKLGFYFLRLKSIWLPYDVITYFGALRLFKKIKPDVINLQNFRELSFSVLLAAKKLGIPVIYSIYDYWLFCPKIDLATEEKICKNSSNCVKCVNSERFGFLKSLLAGNRIRLFNKMKNKFDKFIVLSENSKNLAISQGLPKEKIEIIQLPFSDLRISAKEKVDPNLLLFMGWIHHRKGLKVLVKAVSLLVKKHPKIKLIALGMPASKSYEKEVKDLIIKHELENNVQLIIERKKLEEVSELTAKAGMIVIPEQWENMSPVLLIESMFNAKPIIASRIGGIPSFIKDKKSGLLAKYDSAEDFAKKIEFYLKNPAKARAYGLNARADALKIFNERTIYKKLIMLYESICKQ